MEDELIKYRWIELQFYFLILDLFKIKKNLMDLMDIVDALAIFGGYNPEEVKRIVQEILNNPRIKPSREEFILICRKHNIQIRTIAKVGRIANRDIYKVIEDDKSDPRMFYNRSSKEQIEIMQTFLNTYNQIRGLGIC